MKAVRLACQSMATRFELLLYGDDPIRLRAAGEEALAEVDRLNMELSAFRRESLVSRINQLAGSGPVVLPAEMLRLLERIGGLAEITDGAFDVTVGPLLDFWGFRGASRVTTANGDVSEILQRIGYRHVSLDKRTRSVKFQRPSMKIDFGGVGKGYALDVAGDILVRAGVRSALLHGGTSSVRAIGSNPDGLPWRVAIRRPFSDDASDTIGKVSLEDESMSVSAVSGRFIETPGGVLGHVIDPRSGQPVRKAELALAVTPFATDSDALSTGLLVLGAEGLPHLRQHFARFRGAVFSGNDLIQDGAPIRPN